MADLTAISDSLAGSYFSRGNTASDQLVAAYLQTQQSLVDNMNSARQSLITKRTFFNNLYSQLTSVTGKIDTFGQLTDGTFTKATGADAKFVTRSVTSSKTDNLTVSGTSDALVGVNQIKVNRLASNDNLVSTRQTLASNFDLTGDYTFAIKIGTKDPVNVTVSLGTETLTNEAALKKISDAINKTTDIGVNASFVKDTSTTGRLTLTAKTTGETNAISFSETTPGVLNKIGLTTQLNTDRTVASGTNAGFKVQNSANLNSEIEMNGVTVTRDTNSISDALTGVNMTLLKPQDSADQAITVSTAVDVSAVKDVIKPILEGYNSLLTFLKNNTSSLRTDGTVTSIYSKVRSVSSQSITSASSGNPNFLSDIGIKIGNDGTLSLNDETKLTKFLQDDPQKVADLFTSSDGLASKISNAITNLTGDTGIIKTRQKSLNSQIDTNSKRTTELKNRINKQADIMRKEYESTLKSYLLAQGQYQMLAGMSTTTTG